MRLASDLEIDGHSAMSKPELVASVTRVDELSLDRLTNSELLRLGRSHGTGVRPSMNKGELIAAIAESDAAEVSTSGR